MGVLSKVGRPQCDACCPEGVLWGSGVARACPLPFCTQPWSRGAGLRLAWPAVGTRLWRWCPAFLFLGCVTLGVLTRLPVPQRLPLQNGDNCFVL